MKKLCAVALAGLMAFQAAPAGARPVSYPQGWTFMQMNEADANWLHLHYTTDPRTSIGLKIENQGYGDHIFVGGQYNRLLKRWNAPSSQANTYLKLGLGVADGDFNQNQNQNITKAAGFVRFAADWETRRWFTSADMNVYAREGKTMTAQKARLGVAPYVADFGALHTWLMVEGRWTQNRDADQGEDAFTITPLVRIFKGSTLLEAGYSSNNEPLFNFVYRF
ncbi:hypothetical protein [Parvularcula sp. IMCC14364]|uniref:hypothetical protein n=1 Tax=Parvularcula sp. IMCC14364 TaxID=3067902 RepID=UPI0027411EBB|nr:hypothetical protein [Parvularcula sp. IMCC14364]